MSIERKELFSEKVHAGGRTYFFDVKESADGIKYLIISESKHTGGDSYEHNRVMVFQEHIMSFNEGFEKAIKFMIEESKPKAYDLEQIRRKYPKAYERWTEEEDTLIREEYNQGKTIRELVKIFQRKPSAIRARLKKLGLV